ncbi:cytidylate kinase [Methanocella sp. CWC-04]|uniref:Cytidylate kinase n=1 Tax=Methanooceanicella nereidis TaxID=2052831 RepID=A0AAP2W4P7_9EURY|nr:AAA family ATPase [Methanocella sp. CWC-04]MCD1293487.1 cytidylate kinase [Methanocella sp. CWC-04]
MIITLGGQPGSGKTSVAKEISSKYGFVIISAGEQFRKLAQEKGMSLEEFGALAEKDPSIDLAIDQRQKELSVKYPDTLVEGRLAGRTINADLKIWLKTPLEIRSERIAKRENISYDQAYDETRVREICELTRYRNYYEIDLTDLTHYDLIIDTKKWDAKGVTKIIAKAIEELKSK